MKKINGTIHADTVILLLAVIAVTAAFTAITDRNSSASVSHEEEQGSVKGINADKNYNESSDMLEQDIAAYVYENILLKYSPYIKFDKYKFEVSAFLSSYNDVDATVNVYTDPNNTFSNLQDAVHADYIIKLTAACSDGRLIVDSVKCSFEHSVTDFKPDTCEKLNL